MWGASFGLHGSNARYACEALRKGIQLSEKLRLTRIPDDYWLALFMAQKGALKITNRTWVTAHAKEKDFQEAWDRSMRANKIRSRIHTFLRVSGLPSL